MKYLYLFALNNLKQIPRNKIIECICNIKTNTITQLGRRDYAKYTYNFYRIFYNENV